MWDDFYKSLDRNQRREILKQDAGEEESLRLQAELVWHLRYPGEAGAAGKKGETASANPGRASSWLPGNKDIDCFVRAFMGLLFLAGKDARVDTGRLAQKTFREAAEDLGLSSCPANGPGRECFIREYENTGRLFIELSKTDPNYSREFFGLRAIPPDRLAAKLRRDLERVSRTVPEAYGESELFAPFTEGMRRAGRLIDIPSYL